MKIKEGIGVKYMRLKNGRVTKFDLEDYDRVMEHTWYLNSWGYAESGSAGRMHRFLMDCPPGKVVDHINHDKLDNRKSNLRVCTIAENSRNARKPINGKTSKYKGVSLHKPSDRWVVYIRNGSGNMYIGSFKDEREAAIAYNKSALRLHGEFACVNKID